MRLFCLPLLFVTLTSFSQTVTINDYKIDENGVISFNLAVASSHSNREKYEVQFYSSIDGFNDPIPYKIDDLSPGENANVSFLGGDQFGSYEGPFQLRAVATATIFPVKIIDLNEHLKIGKKFDITWLDYQNIGNYKIDLYQGTEQKSTLGTAVAGMSFSGTVPKALEKGSYSILITPQGRSDLASEQIPVTLKKAINPLIFAGVAVLAGGGAVVLSGGSEGSNQLPNPPNPPSGE